MLGKFSERLRTFSIRAAEDLVRERHRTNAAHERGNITPDAVVIRAQRIDVPVEAIVKANPEQ